MNEIRLKAIKFEAEMYGVATHQFVDGFVNGYQQGEKEGVRKFAEWLISEVALDCYTCPVTACFYDKNAKCVDELIKKYKEQCSEPITDKFNEGRQQS